MKTKDEKKSPPPSLMIGCRPIILPCPFATQEKIHLVQDAESLTVITHCTETEDVCTKAQLRAKFHLEPELFQHIEIFCANTQLCTGFIINPRIPPS